ncbi:2-methylaconitate cis-trans isomerase [Micromonospora rhizosphaerae]|uniref:2-methylaconitate cis-trans isomerase n=1 Tax=Micromonospora rhizosphaerae TaxID=568872 RepID=A0A1C6SAH1_9ACTN|nr:PrpF domain-containing protein [Micromonospora rhizosphaerae]SCL26463.1 2-methylaconitate cis-trans isomerase [Micromonospora rhizosphaerae]
MRVPAVLMRGGTSKAVFFHEADLPTDPVERDRFILAAYGSPDPDRRQINGLGGATSTTSKVAIIGDGAAHGVDITYEFGQVSIDQPLVDRRGNCGNISSAVGPFAVDERLVTLTDPITQVRFLNLNTGKKIVAHVPTTAGAFDPIGDFAIPGVPGTGSRIRLDYLDPGGAVTGRLLPTGNVRDTLEVPGVGTIEVSLVDAANPLVFVRWRDLGLDGSEKPDAIDADPALLARIEAVRAAASVLAGIAGSVEEATRDVPSVPKLAFVGPPRPYRRADGGAVAAEEITLRASMMSMGRLHRSYPLTGAICTAVAAAIPGTIAAEASGADNGVTRIGHPAGVMDMEAHPELVDGAWTVDAVAGYRTARRLMEGWALVPDRVLSVPVAVGA